MPRDGPVHPTGQGWLQTRPAGRLGARDGAASTSTVSPDCLAVAAPPPTRSDLVRGVRDNGRVMVGVVQGSVGLPPSELVPQGLGTGQLESFSGHAARVAARIAVPLT